MSKKKRFLLRLYGVVAYLAAFWLAQGATYYQALKFLGTERPQLVFGASSEIQTVLTVLSVVMILPLFFREGLWTTLRDVWKNRAAARSGVN